MGTILQLLKNEYNPQLSVNKCSQKLDIQKKTTHFYNEIWNIIDFLYIFFTH